MDKMLKTEFLDR